MLVGKTVLFPTRDFSWCCLKGLCRDVFFFAWNYGFPGITPYLPLFTKGEKWAKSLCRNLSFPNSLQEKLAEITFSTQSLPFPSVICFSNCFFILHLWTISAHSSSTAYASRKLKLLICWILMQMRLKYFISSQGLDYLIFAFCVENQWRELLKWKNINLQKIL